MGDVWWQSLMTALFLKEPFAGRFREKEWRMSPNTILIGLIQPGLFSSVSSILTFCGLYCRNKNIQPDTSRFFSGWLRPGSAWLRLSCGECSASGFLVFFQFGSSQPIQFKPIQFKGFRHDHVVVTLFHMGKESVDVSKCVVCKVSLAPYPSWPRVKPGTAFALWGILSLQSSVLTASWLLPVVFLDLAVFFPERNTAKFESWRGLDHQWSKFRHSHWYRGFKTFVAPTSKPTPRPWCMRKYLILTLN